MAKRYFLLLLSVCIIAGCSIFQTGGEIQSGRAALLSGKPEVALNHFLRAVEANPNYANDFTPLQEGVWTYLGRAYYDMGKLPEASEALRQALSRNENDFMARLYLGLTLLRQQSTVVRTEKSFSLQDIMYALKERVSPKRVASLVKERGVNFALTEDSERELRRLGADNELVEQIKAERKTRTEESTRQQGLREMERALKEILNWFEYIGRIPQGQFWDPGRKIRSQVETSLAMIANKREGQQELTSSAEWVGRALEEEIDLARRDEQERQRRMQRR